LGTSRENVLAVFEHRSNGTGVMWTGHPDPEIVQAASEKYGIENNREALFEFFRDDCRHIGADGGYRHPEGREMFDVAYGISARKTLSAPGCFAETDDLSEIERYPWPDVKYCDFTDVYKNIDRFQDKMVFTGLWGHFFHIVADFFGMENYFCKMYEAPELVEALTEKVVDYYVAANEKYFEGFETTVLCHEIDHLDGILHMDIADTVVEATKEQRIDLRKNDGYAILNKTGVYDKLKELLYFRDDG